MSLVSIWSSGNTASARKYSFLSPGVDFSGRNNPDDLVLAPPGNRVRDQQDDRNTLRPAKGSPANLSIDSSYAGALRHSPDYNLRP
jgi:hypothetical protein